MNATLIALSKKYLTKADKAQKKNLSFVSQYYANAAAAVINLASQA